MPTDPSGTPRPWLNPMKPAFRAPCNGCGLCCATQLCEVAAEVFPGASAPCPALEWEDGRAWCGVLRRAGRYITPHWPFEDQAQASAFWRPLVEARLGIGAGCGMEDGDVPSALIDLAASLTPKKIAHG